MFGPQFTIPYLSKRSGICRLSDTKLGCLLDLLVECARHKRKKGCG